MGIQLASKRAVLIGLKVFLGSVGAFVAVLTGKGTCPPNFLCWDLGYFMPISFFSVSMVLIAMVLLISAFKDIFDGVRSIDIGRRDIESVADRDDAGY